MQLQEGLDATTRAGIRLVAISYDSVETLEKFSERAGIEFALLSDPKSQVIDAYGMRNSEVPEDSERSGIPHPGTLLIDAEGIVRAKLLGTVRQRHSVEELVSAVNDVRQ